MKNNLDIKEIKIYFEILVYEVQNFFLSYPSHIFINLSLTSSPLLYLNPIILPFL